MVITKKALFVMNEGGDSLSSFGLAGDGSLTEAPGSPVSFPTSFSWNLHLGRQGKGLFVGEESGSRLFGFTFRKSTGELTELPASPATTPIDDDTGSGLSACQKKPEIVMPANDAGTSFQVAKVGRDGSVTAVGVPQMPVDGGGNAHGRSPDGKLLAVANDDGVFSIAVDRKSGELTLIDSDDRSLDSVNDLQVLVR